MFTFSSGAAFLVALGETVEAEAGRKAADVEGMEVVVGVVEVKVLSGLVAMRGLDVARVVAIEVAFVMSETNGVVTGSKV